MSYDGSGNFIRISNWQSDATAGIKIRADRHDGQDNDFANGLSNVICKDGQSQPTANIPLNAHRLVNVQDPVNPQDAATKHYVDNISAFSTGLTISGADANGRLTFSSATGVNGLAFTGADLSWLARLSNAAGPGTPPNPPARTNRLVLNDKPDGSGTDVVTVNDDGSIVTTGAITAGAVSGASAASGNVHFWWYGPGTATGTKEDRMVMYTAAASYGHGYLRVNGGQTSPQATYTFQNDGQFKAPGAVFSGAAYLNTDGNLSGSAWTNYAGGHADAYTAISAQIEARALAYANDRVSNLQFRRGGQQNSGGSTNYESPAGCVVTGYQREVGTTGQVYWIYFRQMQWYNPANGQWVNFHD